MSEQENSMPGLAPEESMTPDDIREVMMTAINTRDRGEVLGCLIKQFGKSKSLPERLMAVVLTKAIMRLVSQLLTIESLKIPGFPGFPGAGHDGR